MLSRFVFLRLSCGQCILLGSEGHASGRSDADVYDPGTGGDIDGLVGVLRDVVLSRAVVLYEDVIDCVVQLSLDRGTDPGYGWGELEERRRGISWMPVDWVAVGKSDRGILCRVERRCDDLPSLFISPCTATSRGTSPPTTPHENERRTKYSRKRKREREYPPHLCAT